MKKELISDIKKYVNYLLIPLEDMYYHHYEHALSVMERSVYLATMEWCSEEEIEMLIIAALFHDTGFVIQYDWNEFFGAKIANNYLRTILYPDDKTKIIQNIILATIPDRKPNTLLEKIIKDADMDNLWRDDFFDVSEKLKTEREIIKNIKIKDPDWQHASLSILKWHTFYTSTQMQERQTKLEENKKKLKEKIEKQN
jgi:HD superfamily phosphodiesterase